MRRHSGVPAAAPISPNTAGLFINSNSISCIGFLILCENNSFACRADKLLLSGRTLLSSVTLSDYSLVQDRTRSFTPWPSRIRVLVSYGSTNGAGLLRVSGGY